MSNTQGPFVTISIPRKLHERAKKVSQICQIPITHMLRNGLDQQVTSYEERLLAEAERERLTAEAKRPRRSSLAPPLFEPRSVPKRTVDAAPVDRLSAAYEREGARVRAVFDTPSATRADREKAVRAAVDAIKHEAPLTHPSDEDICRRLEDVIVRLREDEPLTVKPMPSFIVREPKRPAPPTDPIDTIGTIDLARVRRSGDVP